MTAVLSGKLDLGLNRQSVVHCRVDYSFMVAFDDETTVTVESDFVYRAPDGFEHVVRPEDDPVSCGAALVISRLAARRGTAFEDGRLEVEFDDGSMVLAPGAGDHESWNVTGADGSKVVSIPGGDLAVWQAVSTDGSA